MCQCIYLGSNVDLGELCFNEDKPGFYYKALLVDEREHDDVAKLLASPYLYFLGGSQGCSCSLSYDLPWDNEPDLNAEREENMVEVQAMLSFLREATERAELRLLCTWWDVAADEMDSMEWKELSADGPEFQFPLDHVLQLPKPVHEL